MGLFKQIAAPLIAKNIPVVPLRPKTKIAFLANWPAAATTNPEKIEQWDEEYPDANGACVAQAKDNGIWVLEIDREGYLQEIERQTGKKIPLTLTVRSSPGRGHLYWRHSSESISMGNIKVKGSDGKEVFSVRADNSYVVAPLSYHPTSGLRYELIRDEEVAVAPDWLVQWCISQKSPEVKTGHAELDDDSIVHEGSRDNTMASILGKARQILGMDREQLYEYARSVNEKRFRPPLTDADLRRISGSIGRYEIVEAPKVKMGGKVLGETVSAPVEAVTAATVKLVPYPVFPRWVMKGTSVYDGLVEPVCAVNSRYPEFMFMPSIAVMLNYLAGKVRVEYKNLIPSFYMVSIGRKGVVIKSSSVKDAIEYLHNAGLVDDAGPHTRNAEGKSLVFTAGSPEGLGMEMSRTNCKNAVLLYDELSSLTNKAGIEGSSLTSKLLEMYESQKFSNVIKARKDNFNFEAGSYCLSLIACTTDENFLQHWSKMAGGSSGLDERFFFLYQPEILSELVPYTYVDTKEASSLTRKRVEKAIAQGTYHISDMTPLNKNIAKLGNRAEIRAEKLALYFAIDLGRDEIDEECIERAIEICKYELAVKKYLRIFETTTKEGQIQNGIIQVLQRNKGRIERRELERILHPLRHGTGIYYQSYGGLLKAGYIAEQGTGVKGDPTIVILMRDEEEE